MTQSVRSAGLKNDYSGHIMGISVILPDYPDKTVKYRSKSWTLVLKESLDKKEFTENDVISLFFWRKPGLDSSSQRNTKPSYVMFGKIKYQTIEVDHFTYGEISFYLGHLTFDLMTNKRTYYSFRPSPAVNSGTHHQFIEKVKVEKANLSAVLNFSLLIAGRKEKPVQKIIE